MATTILGLSTYSAAATLPATSYNAAMWSADRLARALAVPGNLGVLSGWQMTVAKSTVTSGAGLVGPFYCRNTASQAISGLANGRNYIYARADAGSPASGTVDFVARATSTALLNPDGVTYAAQLGYLQRTAGAVSGVYNSGTATFPRSKPLTISNLNKVTLPGPLNINGAVTITGALTVDGSVVFNEAGAATADFRVESDTEANMVYLDANGSTDGLLYLGGTTNGITVGKGGELTMIGTATVYEDLLVPMTSLKAAGVHDPGFTVFKKNVGLQGTYTHWFDASTEEELFFAAQLPHSWDGTAITPHVHWAPSGAPTNAAHRVLWGLEYTWANIGGSFGSTVVVYGRSESGLTVNKHYMTNFSAITPISGAQDGISAMLVCRVFRAAASASVDTYTKDAGVVGVDFHYAKNTIGSKTAIAK